MKVLAIAENYIPPDIRRSGFAPLAEPVVPVEVRHWAHASLFELQRAKPTASWRSELVAACSQGEWSYS